MLISSSWSIGWQLPHSESNHRLMVMAMVVTVMMMVEMMVGVTVTLMVGLVVTRGG